jgi:hypothetical protein
MMQAAQLTLGIPAHEVAPQVPVYEAEEWESNLYCECCHWPSRKHYARADGLQVCEACK